MRKQKKAARDAETFRVTRNLSEEEELKLLKNELNQCHHLEESLYANIVHLSQQIGSF